MIDSDEVNILVISDIHFGRPSMEWELIKKETILKNLIEKLTCIEDKWKPHIVAVIGDIGWKGSKSDYKSAEKWFRKLIEKLNVDVRKIIFCPGNHDINREIAKYLSVPKDHNHKEADDLLGDLENLFKVYTTPFKEFINFQKRIGISELQMNKKKNYLCGYRIIKDIQFIVLNTVWFSRSNHDKGKLWIGYPHMLYLEEDNIFPGEKNYDTSPITISLFHHTSDSFCNVENNGSHTGRPATFKEIQKMSHIILCGHNHPHRDLGEDRHVGRGRTYQVGATYDDKRFLSSYWCAIYKIDKKERSLHRRVMYHDNGMKDHIIEKCSLESVKTKTYSIIEGSDVS